MREGDPGDSLYIILAGEVEIIQALGTEDERLIRVQEPGTLVGEISLFDREGLRTASVRALTPVHLYEMSHADFEALLQQSPTLAIEVLRSISLRLQDANNAIIRDLHERNVQLAKAYQDLKAAQAQIVEKERLEQELRLAGQIQQSMLPQALPVLDGFRFDALMIPARTVGGDFYDFIPLDDDHLGIVVADVSDKGMPAAIFMALTRSLTRAVASRGGPPVEVLSTVNRQLLDMNESGMFVSVLYGILHRSTRQFVYARAGHELPLIFDANGEPIAVPHDTGQLLGILEEPALDLQVATIPAGGELLLCTDGVADALNNVAETFGVQRVQETIMRYHGMRDRGLCHVLLESVREFQGPTPQFDDFTLVAVQSL